jgi:dienelactone hydrolase
MRPSKTAVALLVTFITLVPAALSQEPRAAAAPATAQQQAWRAQIRSTLLIPESLPPLEVQTHGRFEPAAGVVAERVTYGTQHGLRVPAILYLPKERRGKIPAIVVVNGHGGDKYSWYAFYSGVLYAQGGAAVLTFDPIGEGERNRQRRSGTRAHDTRQEPREMALRMAGQLTTDVLQAVSYLHRRPEVDSDRIGAVGYSLGSFLVAIAGAIEPRLHACVLAGGGNLDRPGGYWDGTKPMCTGTSYRSLAFLGDRPAVIYALHAARGPTLLANGSADSVVGIPNHRHDASFFKDLQDRAAALRGTRDGLLEFQLTPDVSHRPFFVTRNVALWLDRQLDLPNWSQADIQQLPETHISRWAAAEGVPIDRLYASEDREGGTLALGQGIPGLSRETLSVLPVAEWERQKSRLVYEVWVEMARAAVGPLRTTPGGRYFVDAAGRPVYLTGSHTWNNLIDMVRNDASKKFDNEAYLDFLERHHHNFIRLWAWDSTSWDTRANRELGKDFIHQVEPLPWARTGPGKALDGKPKFDLTKFEDAYFLRLRERVAAAGRRGIYVSVMLFEGWGLFHGNRRRGTQEGWAWNGHPFHRDNNINGIHGDVDNDGIKIEVHSLAIPEVNKLQAAYIRKVVDTLNDLDNVLFEVINEGGQKEWDWWVVKTLHDYERTKPKQHPVGITGHGAERLTSMLASPADWISPGRQDGYGEDPPAWKGEKVSLLDTDHVWGVGGNVAWTWKSFVRGHNPIFMDPYDHSILGRGSPDDWIPLRKSLGQARRLAERLDLAAVSPHDELASTKYCLAQPGAVYVVFLPGGGTVELDLSQASGELAVEWIRPVEGEPSAGAAVTGGAVRQFKAPLEGDAVLLVSKRPAQQ